MKVHVRNSQQQNEIKALPHMLCKRQVNQVRNQVSLVPANTIQSPMNIEPNVVIIWTDKIPKDWKATS